MVNIIIILIMCHLVGDYLFQTRFIAETKGSNWYHLFVHCVLYCVPLAIIFGTHMIIDPLKARWGKINYPTDQILHYVLCGIYLL